MADKIKEEIKNTIRMMKNSTGPEKEKMAKNLDQLYKNYTAATDSKSRNYTNRNYYGYCPIPDTYPTANYGYNPGTKNAGVPSSLIFPTGLSTPSLTRHKLF